MNATISKNGTTENNAEESKDVSKNHTFLLPRHID